MDISKIWPGWTVTDRLGHGGFGHVYKATYAETDAVAAVKVITIPDNPDIIEDLRYSGRSDDEILDLCHEDAERMMEEIKVMQKLKGSANIVSIEDSALRKKEDSIGYDIYIRMEYLTPLKNRIAELSPLTDEAVVKIGCDICSALEICHKKTTSKRQIIHRDIKPDNILYECDNVLRCRTHLLKKLSAVQLCWMKNRRYLLLPEGLLQKSQTRRKILCKVLLIK